MEIPINGYFIACYVPVALHDTITSPLNHVHGNNKNNQDQVKSKATFYASFAQQATMHLHSLSNSPTVRKQFY